ncbi:MAG: 4-alpha-glucanotransferase, partial [Elusimicrobia bacterium]|nr:4-alpha-glucanotransferase [Elusimicrobiota bacterium]
MTSSPPSLGQRTSGVLLHPTSLPGGHGIGDLGADAIRFAEFLAESSQSWWQMFPLGHPGMGNSPYQSLSAHAGNPLLVSLDRLREDGLLTADEARYDAPHRSATRVHFKDVWSFKIPRLRVAHGRFASQPRKSSYEEFCEKNAGWLDDYSLFCAIKDPLDGAPWTRWPDDLRERKKAALRQAAEDLKREVDFYRFVQYQFHLQWDALRTFCRSKSIGLIGDVPIFVAHDSADVWANPNLFWLDKRGRPLYVAGTPPDYFSSSGQRWGNPLYRWDRMRRDGYSWWMGRFRSILDHFDAVRLDHFIGFHRFWRIPAEDETAANGEFVPGPRDHFFKTLFRKLGTVQLIAEDLGIVTPEVKALRDKFGLPGMRVLQFAFGNDPEANVYLPHSYQPNCVVYTGTHDNDTTVGWFRDAGGRGSTRNRDDVRREREFVIRYVDTDGEEINWDLIRLALMSVANTAIVPAQDLLGLGSEARMNTPGTTEGNWEWRFEKGDLTSKIAERL